MNDKIPFDIDEAMRRLRVAVQPFPPAAMFALADDGFASPFEQLIACIISIRTYDEVSLPAAKRLFALGRTPAQVSQLSVAQISEAIQPSTFYEDKAAQILAIAQRVASEHAGAIAVRL